MKQIEDINENIRGMLRSSSGVLQHEPVVIPETDVAVIEPVPSPIRVVSPALRSWLIASNLDSLENVLIDGGYDDLDLMIAQMRSREPITDEILYSIGVVKTGHRARLLAHLEDASITKLTTRRKEKSHKPSVDPSIPSRNHIEDWLTGMNISELLPNFIESGYDDLDEICYLMGTNYPLTDKILE